MGRNIAQLQTLNRTAQLQERIQSQKKLKHIDKISLHGNLETVAKAMESADRESKKLQPQLTVHALYNNQTRSSVSGDGSPQPCFRCGGSHPPSSCRFREASCRYYHKVGHIAKVCFKKARDTKKPPAPDVAMRSNYITEGSPPSPSLDDLVAPEYAMF